MRRRLWVAAGLVTFSIILAVTIISFVRSVFRMVGALFLIEPAVFIINFVSAVIAVFAARMLIEMIKDVSNKLNRNPETPKENDE